MFILVVILDEGGRERRLYICVSILSIYNYNKGIVGCKSDFPEFNIHFLNFISTDNMLGAITVFKNLLRIQSAKCFIYVLSQEN